MAVSFERERVADFNEILERLADNMRRYDSYVPVRSESQRIEMEAAKKLEEIDIDLPLENQPEGLALSALEWIIACRRSAKVGKAMREADIDGFERLSYLHSGELHGRRVHVRSLDISSYAIGTSKKNVYGLLQGTGRYHGSKSGEVRDLWLDSFSGGAIQFEGMLGRVYAASPLIDRYKDYSPAFEVTIKN